MPSQSGVGSKVGSVREFSRGLGAHVDTGPVAAAAVGGIGANAVAGITFGILIPIIAVGLAVLALIILRRRRLMASSAQANKEETEVSVTFDDELSDFVSMGGNSSSGDIWDSPAVDDGIGPEEE
jgi:hypothetical protein